MNGDLVADFDVQGILSKHERDCNSVTVCVRTDTHQVPFGCIQTNNNRVTELVEKPALQQTINAISPDVIATVKPEFAPVTSLIGSAISQQQRVGVFPIDVGQPAQLVEARGEAKQ